MAGNPSGIPESGEGKVNVVQKILLEFPESGEDKVKKRTRVLRIAPERR